MKERTLSWLIALDQFLFSTVTLGASSPDETLSAAAWRWEQSGKLQGKILRPVIDKLFWFDDMHCKESFESELARKQLPEDYKKTINEKT